MIDLSLARNVSTLLEAHVRPLGDSGLPITGLSGKRWAMSPSAPRVMISSTYYDLRQVRADIARFLQAEMGYVVLASELHTFPIDPDVDTIENCTRRVEQEADILVLIIGARYGYEDPERSRSVTNLEYLAARAKGIPVYAFVEPTLPPLIPIWKKNPEIDLTSSVQNPRVLGFLEEVREKDKVWTREFSGANDIVDALRASFAHLTNQGLQWERKLRASQSDTAMLQTLRGPSLRLALERPQSWEVRLLFEEVIMGLAAVDSATEDHRLGIAFGESDHVTLDEVKPWVRRRNQELQSVISTLNKLLNSAVQEALGLGGSDPDVKKIVYVANRIVRAYQEMLKWAERVRLTAVDEELETLQREYARWPDKTLDNIRSWATAGKKSIEDALAAQVDAQITFELVLEIEDEGRAVGDEIDRLVDLYT